MTVLEYLEYADDIGILSSKHQDAQQKAKRFIKAASTIGLKDNTKKIQVMRKNTRVNDSVMIDGKHLEDIGEFTYLGNKVTKTGYCNQDINTRINKANHTFAMLEPVSRATNLSVPTKINISRSNMLSILLHGVECWKTTVTIQQKRGVPDQTPLTHSEDVPPSQMKN